MSQRRECKGTRGTVNGEPTDTGCERVRTGRQNVAELAEGGTAQDHLRNAVLRAVLREDVLSGGAEQVTDQDADYSFSEAEAEEDAEGTYVDGCEFEVRASPGGEQLLRTTVAVRLGDGFDATRLNGENFLAVFAFANFNVRHMFPLKGARDLRTEQETSERHLNFWGLGKNLVKLTGRGPFHQG